MEILNKKVDIYQQIKSTYIDYCNKDKIIRNNDKINHYYNYIKSKDNRVKKKPKS